MNSTLITILVSVVVIILAYFAFKLLKKAVKFLFIFSLLAIAITFLGFHQGWFGSDSYGVKDFGKQLMESVENGIDEARKSFKKQSRKFEKLMDSQMGAIEKDLKYELQDLGKDVDFLVEEQIKSVEKKMRDNYEKSIKTLVKEFESQITPDLNDEFTEEQKQKVKEENSKEIAAFEKRMYAKLDVEMKRVMQQIYKQLKENDGKISIKSTLFDSLSNSTEF